MLNPIETHSKTTYESQQNSFEEFSPLPPFSFDSLSSHSPQSLFSSWIDTLSELLLCCLAWIHQKWNQFLELSASKPTPLLTEIDQFFEFASFVDPKSAKAYSKEEIYQKYLLLSSEAKTLITQEIRNCWKEGSGELSEKKISQILEENVDADGEIFLTALQECLIGLRSKTGAIL